MTIRLRMPKRVRNIFICCGVVFCASSRMMKASFERAAAHEGDRRDLDLADAMRRSTCSVGSMS